jgi:hypothetical protein
MSIGPAHSTYLAILSSLLSGLAVGQPTFVKQAPSPGTWTVCRNGTWQFAVPDSDEFEPAEVPGLWLNTSHGRQATWKVTAGWKTGTYRRAFQVPKTGVPGRGRAASARFRKKGMTRGRPGFFRDTLRIYELATYHHG